MAGADYPHALQSHLIAALEDPRKASFENSVWQGKMAGKVLLTLLAMTEKNMPEANRDNAYVLVSERLKQKTQRGKKGLGHSDESVKKAWEDFKDVAHLWATYELLQQKAKADNTTISPQEIASKIDGPMLATVADALQTAAARKLPNRGGPIIPPCALLLNGFDRKTLTETGYEIGDIADIASQLKMFGENCRGKNRNRGK